MSPGMESALTIDSLLPAKEAERLCTALTMLLDSPVALQDASGQTFAGVCALPCEARDELVLELEPIGYLVAPQAKGAMRAAAVTLIRQLMVSRARYLMASDMHLASVQQDYDELQRQHAALKESEAKYKMLSEELEARVAEQVKLIDERQRQLYEAERLASVGRLAAGVAHEINNPIGFVRSNLGTARNYLARLEDFSAAVKGLPGGASAWATTDMDFIVSDFRDLIEESISGIDRVARIVGDLKDFSSVDIPETAAVDINHLLVAACNLAEKNLPAGATMRRDFGELPPLSCHPGHLSQAFLSVLSNAVQAISEKGRAGVVEVVSRRTIENQTVVEVRDNGVGIASEALPHVFDPFFTTRTVGQGKGLGLTVARDILRAHGGDIEIDSAPGESTVVTMTIADGS